MQPILVAYGTTEGHTRKIAEFVAERLRIRGHRVDLVDTATPAAQQVQPVYQAAFLGGSVHNHRHQSSLLHFVKANLSWLGVIPGAFFSVSLAMARPDEQDHIEAARAVTSFFDETRWHPLVYRLVAGALKYAEHDFFKRRLHRALFAGLPGSADLSQDHEYTDWVDVEKFVDEFLAAAGLPVAPRTA